MQAEIAKDEFRISHVALGAVFAVRTGEKPCEEALVFLRLDERLSELVSAEEVVSFGRVI